MTSRAFFADSIAWLRSEQQLHTEVRPTHKIETERGVGRVEGFLVFASSAGRWAMRGLWALALGAILAMTALPGMARATQLAVQGSGYAGQAAGVACLGIAEVSRRRHRKRAVVELRAADADPATADELSALAGDARGGEAWLVVEAGLEPATLARAQAQGLRCFVAERGRFREIGGDQNGSGSSSPPVK